MWGRATLNCWWWECTLGQPLVCGSVLEVPQKLEIALPCDPVAPLPITHPNFISYQRDFPFTTFIAALFTAARKQKQPR